VGCVYSPKLVEEGFSEMARRGLRNLSFLGMRSVLRKILWRQAQNMRPVTLPVTIP
jgi:hypothetical protein